MTESASNSLHEAAREGNVELVRQLLAAADAEALNARDRLSRTPLHLAAWAGQAGVVRFLCDAGADVGAAAMDDMAAIHFASQKGHCEVVRILLASGAYVNARNRKGMTPLHFSVQGRREDLTKLLIKKGANLSTENKAGKKPADLVRDEGFQVLIRDAELERSAHRAKSNKEKSPFVVTAESTGGRQVDDTVEVRPITVPERPISVSDRQEDKVGNGKSQPDSVERTREEDVVGDNGNKSIAPRRKKAKVTLSHLSFGDGTEEEILGTE